MKIGIAKEGPGDDLLLKFRLDNGDYIIFNAKENNDNEMFFEVEFYAEHALLSWLKARLT